MLIIKDMFILYFLGFFFVAAVICQALLYVSRTWGTSIPFIRDIINRDGFSSIEFVIDVLSIVLLWYSISLSFTFFNKWLMQVWRGGFDFPIFITSIHLSMKFFISQMWSVSPTIERIEPLSCRLWSTVVFPIGFLIAIDIILSNTAILFLPLSLVTSIKGSSLIFTFLWGIIIEIEKFQWNLLFAVFGITLGLAIAVANSLQVNAVGVALTFGAACAGGLRWALLQLLEFRDPQSKSVMVTLYRFTPASLLSIIPLVLMIEADKLYASTFWKHKRDLYDAMMLCSFGGLFAFALVVVEVKLVRLTSALTMSVFGQVKEIVQIFLAMILFRENLTMKSALGIGVSVLASIYYRYVVTNSKKEATLLIKNKSEEELNLIDDEAVEAEVELVLVESST